MGPYWSGKGVLGCLLAKAVFEYLYILVTLCATDLYICVFMTLSCFWVFSDFRSKIGVFDDFGGRF